MELKKNSCFTGRYKRNCFGSRPLARSILSSFFGVRRGFLLPANGKYDQAYHLLVNVNTFSLFHIPINVSIMKYLVCKYNCMKNVLIIYLS